MEHLEAVGKEKEKEAAGRSAHGTGFSVAVIGAGIVGRGIAQAAALGGYRTILEDILPNALRKAQTEIRASLDQALELGKINATNAEAAFSRLEFADSVDQAAREADLVIEAVPDELESKLEIFTMLDKFCRPDTILASNTLLLRISELAQRDLPPRKMRVGMRFSDPEAEMRDLEKLCAGSTRMMTPWRPPSKWERRCAKTL